MSVDQKSIDLKDWQK